MQEWWIEFQVAFECKDEDQRDEIVARLKEALQSTEWKLIAVEDCNAERMK